MPGGMGPMVMALRLDFAREVSYATDTALPCLSGVVESSWTHVRA